MKKLNIDWTEMGLVAAAGAVGGILSFFYASVYAPLVNAPWWTCFALPALGAGAGCIGVYVIANSDTRDLRRCLVFAMLCGIFPKPVFDAGSALVKQTAIETRKTGEIEDTKKEAEKVAIATNALPESAKADVSKRVKKTATATSKLLRQVSKFHNPEAQELAQTQVKETFEVMEKLAKNNDLPPTPAGTPTPTGTPGSEPDQGAQIVKATTSGLTEVALASLNTGASDVTQEAIESLSDIGQASKSTTTRNIVKAELANILAAAKLKGEPQLEASAKIRSQAFAGPNGGL